jgi:hypothetical protein
MDELCMCRPGEGIYRLELVPDATAPSLTRLRVRHADKAEEHPLTLAEIQLTTADLEELAWLCTKHVARARPHDLAAIEAACSSGGQARAW